MKLANGRVLAPPAMAELVPQITQSYYYPDAVGMELERNFAMYGEIYKAQPWIRTVIDKRANAVARLPVNVWDVNGNTRKLDTRSKYATLMANPCEYMDNYSFWAFLQTCIDIYGEAYLAMVKDENGVPTSFMPMHPSRVAIKRDPKSGEYTYYFQAGAGMGTELVSFPASDVVPFRLYNPLKLERGLSRLESLRSTIFAEDSSRNATAAMWGNSGRPNVVLTSEKALGHKGRERLADAFRLAHAGSSNAGKALVLEDGVTAAEFQLTAVEMQFIESRQLNREEVCGVYDLAPPIVHILDRATFSNISAQMRAFYRDTMAPVLEFIQSVMDKYVGAYWLRKNAMKFAVDDVIRGDWEARSDAGQHAVNAGGMTPNEYRELMGFNRSDNPKADDLYANSAMQKLGEPSEQLRMTETAVGTTPDGIQLAPPPPATTPVASLDNSKPTSVPALPAPKPQPGAGTGNKPPVGNMAPPGPAKPNKHLRRIKGAIGRNQNIDQVATRLYEEYPDEWEEILDAVAVAIREQKGNN